MGFAHSSYFKFLKNFLKNFTPYKFILVSLSIKNLFMENFKGQGIYMILNIINNKCYVGSSKKSFRGLGVRYTKSKSRLLSDSQ